MREHRFEPGNPVALECGIIIVDIKNERNFEFSGDEKSQESEVAVATGKDYVWFKFF
jgi:hypothetical protein